VSPTVSIIIVNFNAGAVLAQTLASLPDGLSGVEWEAVVVDNDSSDGSECAALAGDARVRLLRLPDNAGFAFGVNAGATATSSPFVLILNPDCALSRGAVRQLLDELDRYPACAVIGPRILDPDGNVQESARGDPTVLTGLFGRTSALSRVFPWLPVVRRNLAADALVKSGESSQAVDWISGACMLVRRDAFDRVAGFDAGYFLYWEDADFCKRLRNAGWHIRYMPVAVAAHEVGQSSRNVRSLANEAFHRSAYRYYTTHVIPQRWHPGRPLARVILALRSALKSLPRSSPPSRRSPGTQ
jgi:N-acetylglucosaminyl-diphospho-decaprenol L-rhamnosyltransferase